MIWFYQKMLSRRLLTWGAISLLAGAVWMWSGTPFWQGFGAQAAAWGLIDALIALFGQRGLSARLDAPVDAQANARKARSLRRILWINTALDMLYIAGGLVLALGARSETNSGLGWGIVVQGAFLFIFDLLHALWTPIEEVTLPELDVFERTEYLPYRLEGTLESPLALLAHGFPGTPGELRPLAEVLHTAGWTVSGLLVPGLGRELPHLFQQRAAQWAEWLAGQVETARTSGRPVIVVGFSLGGAISAAGAARVKPDLLVLLSPFWWEEPFLLRLLLAGLGLISSVSIQPFRMIPASFRHMQQEARSTAVDLSGLAPSVMEQLRQARVPLVFIDQFRRLSRLVRRSAESLEMPVLILHGAQDTVAQPRFSRRLAKLIGPNAIFEAVPGDHHTFMPDGQSFEIAAQKIIAMWNKIQSP